MTDFALRLQQLPTGTDRVLVLGQLAGSQSGEGWFTPAAINAAFEAFRVPPPSNTHQALAQLRTRQLVLRRAAGGGWSLTPKGRERVLQLIGTVEAPELTHEATPPHGAEFAHAVHTLIPPFFAPVKWGRGIQSFLARFDFDSNVFCMTRFPLEARDLDPLSGVIDTIRATLKEHGLVLHLASDRNIDDDLWGNVAAHGWACRYGIGLFENRVGHGLNHNLVAEVGAMLMTGRRCALLKDRTQEALPTDFVGQLYKTTDYEDLEQISQAVHQWVVADLGLHSTQKEVS